MLFYINISESEWRAICCERREQAGNLFAVNWKRRVRLNWAAKKRESSWLSAGARHFD